MRRLWTLSEGVEEMAALYETIKIAWCKLSDDEDRCGIA
jgi:hypothetical protein